MAYVYKITNRINGKAYIGKTTFSIKRRWGQHCREFRKERCEKRPLYLAMKKYGIENFCVEIVEECDFSCLSEREMFWINKFNTYENGYNATRGGDGKVFVDYDLIVETYAKCHNQNQTAKILKIDEGTVRKALIAKNVKRLSTGEIEGIMLDMFTLEGKYIKTFPSARKAAIEIFGELSSSQLFGRVSHILDVCKGKRKTAYGYIWKYH